MASVPTPARSARLLSPADDLGLEPSGLEGVLMHIDAIVVKTFVGYASVIGPSEGRVTLSLRGGHGAIEIPWPTRGVDFPRLGQHFRLTLQPLQEEAPDPST